LRKKKNYLKCHDITKIYKTKSLRISRAVLKGINLEVTQNSLIGIFGSSGSGKTTLLQIIAGFLEPSAGYVEYNGKKINNFSRKDYIEYWQKVKTFLFQDSYDNVFPNLSIRENILLACSDNRQRIEINEDRMKSALKSVNLTNDLSTPCRCLSGGELQRVGLAIAILRNTQLLLLDEPTGELDSSNGFQILALAKNLCKIHNMMGIIVSHDKTVAQFVDRSYLLDNGRLTQVFWT